MSERTELLDEAPKIHRDDDRQRRAHPDDPVDGDEEEGASGLERAWIASRERIRRWTRASTHPRMLV